MSGRSKLIARFRNNPKGAKFSQLKSLLESIGYTEAGVDGSHHVFRKPGALPLVIINHSGGTKPEYTRRVLKALEENEEEGR